MLQSDLLCCQSDYVCDRVVTHRGVALDRFADTIGTDVKVHGCLKFARVADVVVHRARIHSQRNASRSTIESSATLRARFPSILPFQPWPLTNTTTSTLESDNESRTSRTYCQSVSAETDNVSGK